MLLTSTKQRKICSSADNRSELFSIACELEQALNMGTSYISLGGKKLKKRSKLVRFRVGVYRIVFKRYQKRFIYKDIIHRKELEDFLKRR